MVVVENLFQPLLSPNGALAIYWQGRMAQVEGDWVFSEGGAPVLAEHRPLDPEAESPFPNDRHLFSDLTIDREAFTSAAISWGVDGDAFAVWETVWTGDDQGAQGTYPDVTRVYFGHATDARGLTRGPRHRPGRPAGRLEGHRRQGLAHRPPPAGHGRGTAGR